MLNASICTFIVLGVVVLLMAAELKMGKVALAMFGKVLLPSTVQVHPVLVFGDLACIDTCL